MKDKNKKKYVIVPQRLHPSQISEISICCFVIPDSKLESLLSFIVNNGGRVISAVQACGISRYSLFDSLSGLSFDQHCVLAMCQKEITEVFMRNICKEFDFNQKGKGKAFALDVQGYMGAKGPFVE